MKPLSRKLEQIVRHTCRLEGPDSGIKKLQKLTGWSLGEATEWVEAADEPYAPRSIPCPYCGQKLRTAEARQCRRCMRDWHDESNIRRLGTNELWKPEAS